MTLKFEYFLHVLLTKDLEVLTKQFSRKLSEKMVVNPNGSFDVRA